jgi:hypothetical protein
VQAIVEDRVREQVDRLLAADGWAQRFEAVASRQQDPYAAADDVLAGLATPTR